MNIVIKMRFSKVVAKAACSDPVWSGEAMGRKVLPGLMSQAQRLEGDFWIVDLEGIDVVTASAFRASLRALREYISTSFHVPTIFANAPAEIMEEAVFVAEKFGETYLFGTLGADGKLSGTRIVGRLDNTLLTTLKMLQENGESDAKALFALAGVPGVTAWHNRLAELEDRGLVVGRSVGRSRKYRTIAQESIHGY